MIIIGIRYRKFGISMVMSEISNRYGGITYVVRVRANIASVSD